MLKVGNVVFMSDILHHCFLYTLYMYEEKKNSKKDNKENRLRRDCPWIGNLS